MFFAVAGALVGALQATQQADAQRRYANAIKDASKEDLPPAYKAQLNAIASQSQRAQADFQKSLDDQGKLVQAALIGGGGLLVLYLVLK